MLGAAFWGVQLWQLREQVDRYRRYWSEPRGDRGGLVYVAVGDSTAQGIGASRPERGYVGLVAQRLRDATGRPVQIVNLSRTGARIHDVVVNQLPKLAGLHADVVTVAVGANDIRGYNPRRFDADVDALVAALPANAVVGDVPWFMHGGTGRNSGDAAAYMAEAASARGLPVAGLHDAMQRRGWPSMVTDFAADWFHPNDRGYRVWAAAFWEAMGRIPMPPTS
ncbi:MAG: SGNH/GDSL hydrolase family protein [Acidimicrobiales bacterium]